IYPNPARDIITIETDRVDRYSIQITTLNGQLIYDNEMEGVSHRIDLSSFREGVYCITIRSKGNITTRKIMKL
ncbi:MAG: T9SS type A sorting domain-containing protein, partial [Bacteroidota bacterium]